MLVGRDRQVRQVRVEIDALQHGRGGLVLIAGDAGIGKTCLAEAAMTAAAAAGVDTHRTTCWAEAGAPPFWPWSQLLRELGVEPVDTSDRGDHDLARFQLFTIVGDALRAAGAARPRLLVVDDLHWADAPSVRLLAFLAPLLRDTRILVVATYRSSDVDGPSDLGPLLPELVRHGHQITLAPLDRDAFGAFIADLHEGALTDHVVDRLFALTAGNPLFAREVVSLLDASSVVGSNTDELPVPDSVLTTLVRRLAAVSDTTHELLGVASVVGVAFGIELVAETTGLERDVVVDALDEAETAGLARARDHGRCVFAHPLIREAAYRELGLARRVRLHADVAQTLEGMRARGIAVDPAELAHHFGKAAPGGNAMKAVEYAEEAGDRASSMLAYEAAIAHYEYALETELLCPPDPARRADLLLRLGDARLASGDRPAARDAFDAAAMLAREHCWPERLARAALGQGSGAGGFEVAAFDTAQIALLREALGAMGDRDASTRAWLLARLSVALWGEAPASERLALCDEAVAYARSARDNRALAYALAAHCDLIAGPDFCDERLAEAGEIVALARAERDVGMELLGRRLRVLALAELGHFTQMDGEIESYARVADAIRQPLYSWYPHLWRAMRALMEGRFEDSAAACAEAEAIGAAAHSDNAGMLTVSLSLLWLLHIGLPDRARERILGLVEVWQELLFMAQPGIALAAARAGRLEEARELLRHVDLDDAVRFGAEWLPALVMGAEAAAYAGDREQAATLYQRLAPYAHLYAIDGIAAANYGCVARQLGMLAAVLGRADDARTHFAAARRSHDAVGATLLGTLTADDEAFFLGASDAPAATRSGVFACEGEVWALTYEGRTARLRHTKGIADIAQLLAQPGREIHVLDLAAPGAVPAGGAGPALDAQARDAYKRRLVELDGDLEAADVAADAGHSERLHAERETLLAELAGAYGLDGRARTTGDPAERARSAVTQRIKDALQRIEREHASLGNHLRRAVRTGVFCAYEPDGPVEWQVSRA